MKNIREAQINEDVSVDSDPELEQFVNEMSRLVSAEERKAYLEQKKKERIQKLAAVVILKGVLQNSLDKGVGGTRERNFLKRLEADPLKFYQAEVKRIESLNEKSETEKMTLEDYKRIIEQILSIIEKYDAQASVKNPHN